MLSEISENAILLFYRVLQKITPFVDKYYNLLINL